MRGDEGRTPEGARQAEQVVSAKALPGPGTSRVFQNLCWRQVSSPRAFQDAVWPRQWGTGSLPRREASKGDAVIQPCKGGAWCPAFTAPEGKRHEGSSPSPLL